MKSDVEQGSTFADALRKHPKPFDDLYVNLVQAGEIGGILDTILNRLAVYLEKADALARKVKGAMVYPTTVLSWSHRRRGPDAREGDSDLREDVRGLRRRAARAHAGRGEPLSHFMQEWIWHVHAGACSGRHRLLPGAQTLPALPAGDRRPGLKMPIFGPLLQKVAVARFTRTLGTMIASGVPILDGLDIVARTAGNMVIEEALRTSEGGHLRGQDHRRALQESEVFPGMVVQMIAVGEETGAMETMLSKIADFYDDEVDAAVEALTAMLEPLMMVFLGGSVGGLLIAMYLPIFKIAETIG